MAPLADVRMPEPQPLAYMGPRRMHAPGGHVLREPPGALLQFVALRFANQTDLAADIGDYLVLPFHGSAAVWRNPTASS